jgi:hypothetical protein
MIINLFLGNVISFPNNIDSVARCLSLPQLVVVEDVQVIIIGGARKDVSDQLKKYGTVRKMKVLNALVWKKHNDPFYRDIEIDYEALNSLQENSVLLENIVENVEIKERYRQRLGMDELRNHEYEEDEGDNLEGDSMERVGFVDSSGDGVKFSDLWNAAWNKTFMKVPRSSLPVKEFESDYLYGCFPCLFPLGTGIPENVYSDHFKDFLTFLLHLHDPRFRIHNSFLFVAYNIDRRRRICRSAKFLVNSKNYGSVVQSINNVQIQNLSISNISSDPDVQKLLHGLKILTSSQDGTLGSKLFRRNELRSLIAAKGMPAIWMTLNPNDLSDPLVAVLSGKSALEAQEMTSLERIRLVCEDPVAAVEHFHIVITTVLEKLFKTDSKKKKGRFLEKLDLILGWLRHNLVELCIFIF